MDNEYEYQGEGVRQNVQQRFATEEEIARRKTEKQTKRKRMLGVVIAVAVVLGIAFFVCNVIYNSALADWNQNDYLSAVMQFRKISFFRDAGAYTGEFESMLVEELTECSWSCSRVYNSKKKTSGFCEFTFEEDGTGFCTDRNKNDGEDKDRVNKFDLVYNFLYDGGKLTLRVKLITEYIYTINLTQDADGVHIVNLVGALEVGDDYWVTYNRSQAAEG